jgi:hypothetical protein
MKTLVICLITICALTVTPALWAQEQPKQQEKRPESGADRMAGDTLTGCLTETGGAYMLKSQSGEEVAVKGSEDLTKHKNHTVRLTGKMSDEGGKKTLTISKLEHVSASCSQ